MSNSPRWLPWLVGSGLACVMGVSVAEACGGFFRARTVAPERQPSLSREKVLIAYDARTQTQHFIREVAFARATEPFGFVVPTPSRPEVHEVTKQPFTKLRQLFPFTQPLVARGAGGGSGSGNSKGGSPGVTVLEVKSVGSFTAYVLAATDADALATWLADNELVSTKEADVWLEHYVELGFYYVAMRYDPPGPDDPDTTGQADGAVVAETMRVSFSTPLPYYPYLEPARPPGPMQDASLDPRLLELWYVGTEAVVPIARLDPVGEQVGDPSESRFVQPLRGGDVYDDVAGRVDAALEPELRQLMPPNQPLIVQTFQDQKNLRTGFDDVLFVPAAGETLDAERRAALRPLLGLLDPALIEVQP